MTASPNASLFTYPRFMALNTEGYPLAGGKLYSYQAGTLTPQETYTDATLTVPNPNPIILDAFGTAAVWLDSNAYKFNLLDVNGVQQADFPIDNVTGYAQAALAGSTSVLADLASTAAGQGDALVTTLGPLPNEVPIPQHTLNKNIFPVTRWGAVGDGVTDDTAAIQKAILDSVGITNLTQQSTGNVCELLLTGNHLTSTLYLPRYTRIKGLSPACGFTSSTDAPILVVGRSLSENDWLDIWLRDFSIYGTFSLTNQYAIQGIWTGQYGYSSPFKLANIYIGNIGGGGIDIVNTSPLGMMLNTAWDNVEVVNTKKYGLHIKMDIINVVKLNNCQFSFNKLGGVWLEPGTADTQYVQTCKLSNCRLESNGINVGDVPPSQDYGAGSFGFKSTFYAAMVTFDNCYLEGNGARVGDTTGCGIDVTNPYSLTINNCLLYTSNNLVALRQGGNADINGCSIYSETNRNYYFLLDGAPSGSNPSILHIGRNLVSGTANIATWVGRINSATGVVTGFTDPNNNYASSPERMRCSLLRDTSQPTATGAVGYSGVVGMGVLSNYTSGTRPRLCEPTVNSLCYIIDIVTGASALFMLASTGATNSVLISQTLTLFSAALGTASKVNVNYDGSSGKFVVENKTGSNVNIVARFIGLDAMPVADTGAYETRFQ